MKTYTRKTIYIISLFTTALMIFTSCHQRDVPEFNYSDYRRVIGAEGGIINFYEYNPADSVPLVLVKMNFPAGALDTLVVFNMYEFNDTQTYLELMDMDMFQTSDFLYFIPFYESYGYNNQTQLQTDYHLSIEFNDSVEITYNLKGTNLDEGSKLFRIPIPKLDDPDWGDNVWVNWNEQGYPDGYDELDLIYLITGRWTINDSWGTGTPSTINWQEIPNATVIDSTVTFKIGNTDYLYVMGNPYEK